MMGWKHCSHLLRGKPHTEVHIRLLRMAGGEGEEGDEHAWKEWREASNTFVGELLRVHVCVRMCSCVRARAPVSTGAPPLDFLCRAHTSQHSCIDSLSLAYAPSLSFHLHHQEEQHVGRIAILRLEAEPMMSIRWSSCVFLVMRAGQRVVRVKVAQQTRGRRSRACRKRRRINRIGLSRHAGLIRQPTRSTLRPHSAYHIMLLPCLPSEAEEEEQRATPIFLGIRCARQLGRRRRFERKRERVRVCQEEDVGEGEGMWMRKEKR